MKAFVSLEGAWGVALFLDRTIDTHCPIQERKQWEEVRDALYALCNDTDAIVLKVEDHK